MSIQTRPSPSVATAATEGTEPDPVLDRLDALLRSYAKRAACADTMPEPRRTVVLGRYAARTRQAQRERDARVAAIAAIDARNPIASAAPHSTQEA